MHRSQGKTVPQLPNIFTIAGIILTILGLAVFFAEVMRLPFTPSDFSKTILPRWHYGSISRSIRTSARSPVSMTGLERSQAYLSPALQRAAHAAVDLLPYTAAVIAWSILALVLYGIADWITLRELGLRSSSLSMWMIIGLALCWDRFIAQVALGQLSIVLVICIIGAWACLRNGREVYGGILLGLACLIKLFSGFVDRAPGA